MAVLVLVACSTCVAELDVTADVHLHTNKWLGGFSDGVLPPMLVFNNSISRVMVFTDHLDGVVEKGTDRYLSAIRGLTNAKKLAIPGVEVTCGLTESSYDMLVLGLNNESLAELASLYKRGAFINCENGLPALKAVADRYDLVLLAAHPDNSKIPFSLAENAKFCDGFELFDSNHVGYSTNDLPGNLAKFYENGASGVTLTSGIDFHYGPMGAVPTKSLLEAPVTHVLLDSDTEVNEANVVESIRGGRTYATSLLGARIVSTSCLPGRVWDPAAQDRLVLVCAGIAESSLLDEYFTVIVSNGRTSQLLKFKPRYMDGKAVLSTNFAALELPDATACNVNFGGRLITSTIKISPPKAQPTVVQAKSEVRVNRATPKAPPPARPVPNIAGVWVGNGWTQIDSRLCRITVTFRQQGDKLEFTMQADGTESDFRVVVEYEGTIDSAGVIAIGSHNTTQDSSGVSGGEGNPTGNLRLLADGSIRLTSDRHDSKDLEFVIWRQ